LLWWAQQAAHGKAEASFRTPKIARTSVEGPFRELAVQGRGALGAAADFYVAAFGAGGMDGVHDLEHVQR
jgi:hypothetical protein